MHICTQSKIAALVLPIENAIILKYWQRYAFTKTKSLNNLSKSDFIFSKISRYSAIVFYKSTIKNNFVYKIPYLEVISCFDYCEDRL